MEECAKKLQQTVKNVPLCDLQTNKNTPVFYSTRKNKSKQQSFIEKYVLRSEKKSSRKSRAKLFDDEDNQLRSCTKKLFAENDLEPEVVNVKRESLGLLPESCFEDEDLISSGLRDLEETGFTTSSLKNVNRVNENRFAVQRPRNILEKISQNKFAREKLADILHSHNRQHIWDLFQNLSESLHVSIVKNLAFDQRKNMR